MRRLILAPFSDIMACLEAQVAVVAKDKPARRLIVLILAVALVWFVYVPIHELLHVAGCVWPGGSASRLELAPQYGGTILRRFFPFVVSGSDYAGQLTGFDTRGSDFIYLSTCFLPFVLTILFGVPFLRAAAKRTGAFWLAIGVVVGLAPFYNLPGDYFEMGSIVVTRTLTFVVGAGPEPLFKSLRSDDVFKLIGTLIARPHDLQLHGAGAVARAVVVIFLSGCVAVLLTFVTYGLGSIVATAAVGRRPKIQTSGKGLG
jgi:hypothetical protein